MKYHRIIQSPRGEAQFIEDEIDDPRPGEVLIRVQAAGVSFADILMREGVHPEARRKPFTPGWDIVGVVEKIGESVTSFRVGETVAAMPIVGGYAEYVLLPDSELVSVPDHVDPAEAVCMVLNYVTAYQMIHRFAKAKPGETALIQTAAGGVGTALLQLCGLCGVTTYGTASESKLGFVRESGGIPIDYQHSDFVKEIRRMTGSGVDIVFDGIGGWNLWRAFQSLNKSGRLIAYGLQSSLVRGKRSVRRAIIDATGWAAVYLWSFLPFNKRKMHVYSIQMLKRRHPDWFRQDLTAILDLLANRQIKPVIAEKLPLEQASVAHQHLTERATVGKIVLLCGN